MRRLGWALGAPLLVGGMLAAAGPVRRPAPFAPLTPTLGAADEVVATVDGRPILAAEVAAQARARGVSVRQALDDLVDAEVVAGAAAARGLDRDPVVVEAARGAAVRALLKSTFEREVTPAKIPDRAVSRAFEANKGVFDHPDAAHVFHLLVPVARDATPAARAQARAQADELARKAQASAGDLGAFRALVNLPHDGARWKLEEVSTPGTVAPFERAALALKRPGQVSGVVETEYGFHVIYLVEQLPERHLDLAGATPEIRDRLFPQFQRAEFPRFVDEVAAKHHVELHPERLPRGDEGRALEGGQAP